MEKDKNTKNDVAKRLSEICSHRDSRKIHRRDFIKKTAATTAVAAGILSMEEKILLAGPGTGNSTGSSENETTQSMPMGKIGNLQVSRLICGGNLISGYAHSRDLIYISDFMKRYFTDEKIMDTWAICEKNGINTCTIYAGDKAAMKLFKKYKQERGGKMQWLAQTEPNSQNIERTVDEVLEYDAAAVYMAGNLGDRWTFDNRIDLIEKFINYVKKHKVPAGVACHSIEVPIAVESAGIDVDFYMKTLHSTNYWSKRQQGQDKQVIDNYAVDNYWDMDPEQTIEFMSEVKKPWIAYKVLAAGAINPWDGFKFTFENGADFACVGMFDWQVAEDVKIGADIVKKYEKRNRPWYA